jgi:hypothetical protein
MTDPQFIIPLLHIRKCPYPTKKHQIFIVQVSSDMRYATYTTPHFSCNCLWILWNPNSKEITTTWTKTRNLVQLSSTITVSFATHFPSNSLRGTWTPKKKKIQWTPSPCSISTAFSRNVMVLSHRHSAYIFDIQSHKCQAVRKLILTGPKVLPGPLTLQH